MASVDRVTITLPNLVASFLSDQPATNEHYEKVSEVSHAWLVEKCDLGEKAERMLSKGDFAYFCAVTTPEADLEKYKEFCDWVNWVFPFDDLFDHGELKDDPEAAKDVLDNLMNCMHGTAKPGTKFVAAHHDIWVRIIRHQKVYSHLAASSMQEQADVVAGTCNRYVQAMTDYCANVQAQVRDCSNARVQKLEDLIEIRRNSVGVKPLYVFVEYSHELQIPDEVFEHQLIKEIERLCIDWVLIQNDIISYRIEEAEGVNHNLISACRAHGMAAQEAFDHLGSMLEKIYLHFVSLSTGTIVDLAIAQLPSWGESVDAEIQKYIEGLKNCVKANLRWSFRTDRYFGANKDEVKGTGKVDVLKKPSYLNNEEPGRDQTISPKHIRWFSKGTG